MSLSAKNYLYWIIISLTEIGVREALRGGTNPVVTMAPGHRVKVIFVLIRVMKPASGTCQEN